MSRAGTRTGEWDFECNGQPWILAWPGDPQSDANGNDNHLHLEIWPDITPLRYAVRRTRAKPDIPLTKGYQDRSP